MALIQIIDKKKNELHLFELNANNALPIDSLRSRFPTAIGLKYLDPIENEMKLFVAYVTTTGTWHTFDYLSFQCRIGKQHVHMGLATGHSLPANLSR